MTSNKKYNWVFFDLDGTLADSLPAMYQVYLDFLNEFNIRGTKEEFDELNGPSLVEVVALLKARYHLTDSQNSFAQNYRNKITSVYQHQVKPINGANEILQELTKLDYKMMLVTSSAKDIAAAFIKKQNWEKYFEGYVFGNEISQAKPSPEIYELALKRANISANTVAVIEDSCNGILSAKQAGIFVIGIVNSQSKEALLKAGADITINHLREMTSILEVKA